MVRKNKVVWALLVTLLTGGVLAAQAIVRRDQAPQPIDDAMTKQVIDVVLKELDENYVFPDVAKKMVEAIRKRQADNDYAGAKTGPELARLLTEHLQEVSKDKHLRVRYTAEQKGEQKARMTAMARKSNAGYRRVERLAGNVGYLELDNFAHSDFAAGPAAAAMTFLANTDALIIDLRRNGGGSPQGVALLCSYLFDADKPVLLNTLYWRRGDRTDEFWTVKDLAGPRYVGKDVYVLTQFADLFGGGGVHLQPAVSQTGDHRRRDDRRRRPSGRHASDRRAFRDVRADRPGDQPDHEDELGRRRRQAGPGSVRGKSAGNRSSAGRRKALGEGTRRGRPSANPHGTGPRPRAPQDGRGE
jgi:N-terminal domain of Peptidase_S41 in eukaryotic IRBP/Peptidase family S41